MKTHSIAVCIPARDMMHTSTAFDLATAIACHVSATDDTITPLFSQGTLLVSQRTELVLEAVKADSSHMLFIDSDMRFPSTLITRLVEKMELAGIDVLATNCARRRMPTGPTAANYDPATGKKLLVYTEKDSGGLEAVDSVGTGIMLIRMSVFEKVQAPWFATPWVIDANGYQGEDIFFCRLLKQHGIQVYIDHDVSKDIGHVGFFEYRHEHTWAVRETHEAAKKETVEKVMLAVM